MKKINIIILSMLIMFFSVSIYNISYGTSNNYKANVTNETNDSIKSERENNYLKSLSVEGYELYPEFNKNILTYYIVLSSDISSLDINAETENENAKIKITGNTKLTKAENTIKITVTAENKTTKTYNIIATKQQDNGLSLSSLYIEGTDLSSKVDSLNHYCTFDYQTNKDTIDLNVEATANQENATIEIVGDKGLTTGENLITIILNNGTDTSIYEVLVNINAQKTQITETKEDNQFSSFFENLKGKVTEFFQNIYNVIAFLCAILAILIILIIIAIIKLIKSKKADKNRERLRKRVK